MLNYMHSKFRLSRTDNFLLLVSVRFAIDGCSGPATLNLARDPSPAIPLRELAYRKLMLLLQNLYGVPVP
jgi:hypothetical protein